MGRVDGKVALITGGARGQGRSHALTLAREGADVILCDIASQLPTVPYAMPRMADLEETVDLVQSLGRRCIAVQADVRDGQAMKELADRGVEEFGKIDILCANAGIASYGLSWELSDEQWDEMIDVNLSGVWKSCKAVIPHMIKRSAGGSIVITSSNAGLKGFSYFSHYTAAKHGVIGLMKALAKEVAEANIRVNCICPCGVNTPQVVNDAFRSLFDTHPDMARELVNLLPVELIEPEDVSNAIVWLVSDEARYVTGVALPVDAGFTIR